MMFVYHPLAASRSARRTAQAACLSGKVAEVFGNMSVFAGVAGCNRPPLPVWSGAQYYLQVWIAITTSAVSRAVWDGCARHDSEGPALRVPVCGMIKIYWDLVSLLSRRFPLAAVIVLNSVVYDGWRQVYFVSVDYFAGGARIHLSVQRRSGRRIDTRSVESCWHLPSCTPRTG